MRAELDLVVRQGIESWRVALSNVAGVYLISDPGCGKLYVGSATGEGGIWQRWCEYSANSHGGNRDVRLLLEHDSAAAQRMRFSILEIADLHASAEEVLRRESH